MNLVKTVNTNNVNNVQYFNLNDDIEGVEDM